MNRPHQHVHLRWVSALPYNTPGIFFMILLGVILLLPQLASHDPLHAESGQELRPPAPDHWLGTDHLGRDVWSRLVVGGQRTLIGAVLATGLALTGGLTLSLVALAGGPGLRYIIGVVLDALLAFPVLILALAITTALTSNVWSLALATGLAGIAPYGRVAWSALQVASTAPHIEGARSIGATRWHIFTHHILPTARPALTAFGSVIFGWMLIYQAALSFLGLGGNPSMPDWGVMLNEGRGFVQQVPLLTLCPAGLLALFVWLANRLADTLGQSPVQTQKRIPAKIYHPTIDQS